MGLPFNRTPEGKIDQRRFGGHTADHGKTPVRRACYAADRTGHMILQTLFQNCVKLGINFFNEFYALDLITVKDADGNTQVAGVVAYELATGDLHVFHSKAVIFATGGFGKIYKTTSNAHTLTGDGVGIVWRKGLPLEDIEFFQFHPTGLAGLGILLTEGARGEGAILRNASGERFMERYAPTIKDLAPRDIVARCMVKEVLEGRGAGPTRTTSTSTARTSVPRSSRRSSRHHRVRPHVPRRRPRDRAGAGHADRALRDGRHPHQQQRRGAAEQRHRRSGPVRRR
jgi:succinate dehydrogenase / fumarate reductase flavoprotein subunit